MVFHVLAVYSNAHPKTKSPQTNMYSLIFMCVSFPCFAQTVGGLPSGHRRSEKTPREADRTQRFDLRWRVVP